MKTVIVLLITLFLCSNSAFSKNSSIYKLAERDILQIEGLISSNANTFDICHYKMAKARVELNYKLYPINGALQTEGQVFVRCYEEVDWKKSEYCQFRRASLSSDWIIHYCD